MSIMADILLSIKEPKILTHIMYATQLSYIQLKKHLEMLINLGLAVEVKSRDNQRFFKLTERGKIFIITITKDGNSSEPYQEGFGVK
ncbi:MAG: hypothetical protein O6761_02550 [Thaumarchaeota archaeon]|nr:hypothetical protein [Nitrososphaerota archaeon]